MNEAELKEKIEALFDKIDFLSSYDRHQLKWLLETHFNVQLEG